jgi:hypothetical protein
LLVEFSSSSGLKVNYRKSSLVPINVPPEKLDLLADILCQKGTIPFTYPRPPLCSTKPKMEDFLPLVQKIERRLVSTYSFLSPGGKLKTVNLVLSSTAVFHCCTLKLCKGIIQQIDKYRKHCLWRGSDLNAKQTYRAAWIMVCLPKSEGGLGVLNLATHNDSLLLKFLYKFFTRANIPWFNLVLENYYHSGKLHGQQRKGFFWWRDLVKLIDSFKGLAKATAHNEDTILLWNNTWNDSRYNSSLERQLK